MSSSRCTVCLCMSRVQGWPQLYPCVSWQQRKVKVMWWPGTTLTPQIGETTLKSDKDLRFGLKVDQIGHNCDKSWTFWDQISVHFDQNILISDLAKYIICPIWGNQDTFGQIWYSWCKTGNKQDKSDNVQISWSGSYTVTSGYAASSGRNSRFATVTLFCT